MEDETKILRACIVSHKGGVPTEDLDDEYYKLTGNYIPYLRMGYNSLYEFLANVKGIVKERNVNGKLVYKVTSPNLAHIDEMVSNQKDQFTGSRQSMKPFYSRSTSTNWQKRKALNQGRTSRRGQKRQKNERNSYSKFRGWNKINDRSISSNEENAGDFPSNLSEYEHWYNDEYAHPVKITEQPPKSDVVFGPMVNGKLLIGDDFFLQLAIRNVGSGIWRTGPNTALHSGLCVSGQTIRDCTRRLMKVEALASKVVIMLGAEDIYRNHTSDDMIQDMEELLEVLETKFAVSKSATTICTIPPLANLAPNCHAQQLATLTTFNCWIRDLWFTSARYNLIDFFQKNTNAQIMVAYDYFQMDARMVSGTSYPYVLWNVRGRRIAMNLLRSGDT